MLRYTLRKVPSAVLVLFIASVIIFLILRLVPGDPAQTLAGPDATDETIDGIRSELGLNDSLLSQYLSWLGQLFTLDLGRSYVIGGKISDLVISGAGNTLVLTVSALVIAVILALILSVSTVIWPYRWLQTLSSAVNTLAVALPPFVTGVAVVVVFAVVWPILPAGGLPPDGFFARPDITVQYLILPSISLALPVAATLSRFLTEALRTEMEQQYVLTVEALGVSRATIVLRYALRNALPTTVTVLGLQVGQLLGGAILVEAIFAWPGIGQLIQEGINRRDYPVVQILLLVSVAAFIIIQLVTDLIHATLDPRIRLGGRR